MPDSSENTLTEPLEMSPTEQRLLDEAMGGINLSLDTLWDLDQQRHEARRALQRAADQWHLAAVTLLRLRGLDPREHEVNVEGDHVTILRRPPTTSPPPAINVEDGPPRVYVPYVRCGLLAEAAAIARSLYATFVDLTGDLTAYFRLVEKLWSQGACFMLLEQDVVPADGLVEAMWHCPEPWCVGQYPPGPQACTLGLVKFGSQLLHRVPDAMVRAARLAPERLWTELDLALCMRVLQDEEGLVPHVHGPVLRHDAPRIEAIIPDVIQGPIGTMMQQITQSRFVLGTVRGVDAMMWDSRTPKPDRVDASGWLNCPLALRADEPALPWGMRRPGQRHLEGPE